MSDQLLVETTPDTHVPLPHLTWSSDARDVVKRLCAAPGIKPYTVPYMGADGVGSTFHVSVHAVTDGVLFEDLWRVAEALYDFPLPGDEAAILTNMVGCDGLLLLFAWLRAALVELSGQPLAAHVVGTGESGINPGDPNAAFPLHADQWHTELLLNVFNRVRPGGETTLIPIDMAWEIVRANGVPEHEIEMLRHAIASAETTAQFWDLNRLISWPDDPRAVRIADDLARSAFTVALKRGQGYLVNDRRWLHGRLAIQGADPADRNHRLYRLGYNSRQIMQRLAQRGFDWAAIGDAPSLPGAAGEDNHPKEGRNDG